MQALLHVQASVFTVPLCSTRRTKCLHGDLHGSPSARQLSHSMFQISKFQHPQLAGQSSQGRAEAGGVRAARSMAVMAHSHPNGWGGSLRVSSIPKRMAPSLTHFSRSARDWLVLSQSHATAPIRPAVTLLGPLFLLGQLRQSHPVSVISGPGSHSQLQVHHSPRRHWLVDWVGEKASASVMACRSIASRKGQFAGGWVGAFYRDLASPLSLPRCKPE